MPDCVDLKAREDLAKLYTEVRQHSTDWWGPDKQNGKRSEVVNLSSRVDAVEVKIKHYEDTRESSCLGLQAFREYLEKCKTEEADMKIEQVKGKTLMTVQWIQVVGIILVALIALWK